ncbi:MAG: Na+/H+ antiporter NhaA [Pseudomonadota bacterium]|nr:Na+/H+ antiporter NhaA [Pseudomonadota bacterium]
MAPALTLSRTFVRFFDSEKAGGVALLVCTLVAIALANSPAGPDYARLLHMPLAGLSVEHWVNDGLMAIFFLLVGLELERELYVGELSDFRTALLPTFAALGGIAVPVAIHVALNAGTPMQPGAGIPMATDIAFALGVLALLGTRAPASLKIFLTALAVMDDLGAVVVIGVFYGSGLSGGWLGAALAVFAGLIALNRARVMNLPIYLLGGAVLWFCMLKSGVHATIAGVLLAFAIPFSTRAEDEASPSHRLEHFLHRPVAFGVLPIFALANAGIVVDAGWFDAVKSPNGLGILAGLVVGKPIGIALASFAAVALGICVLPGDLKWRHVVGAGMLGGIGFTMSIFIANLAFSGQADVVNASKVAILAASLFAGCLGFAWLAWGAKTSDPAAG